MRRQNNGYFKLQGNGSQTISFAGKGKCWITCRGTPTSQILFKRRRVVSQASARLVMTFFFSGDHLCNGEETAEIA